MESKEKRQKYNTIKKVFTKQFTYDTLCSN